MKSEILPPPPVLFRPVTITLTFETQAELDALGKLFNCAGICNALAELGFKHPFWATLRDARANIDNANATIKPLLLKFL